MKMAKGAEMYLKHLKAEGKSPSTCGTARRTLALLGAHIGADSETGSLTAEKLNAFFASEAATKQQGKPRAAASDAQLQRIARAAFAWWQSRAKKSTAAAVAS
jgi:hypothetical protein